MDCLSGAFDVDSGLLTQPGFSSSMIVEPCSRRLELCRGVAYANAMERTESS